MVDESIKGLHKTLIINKQEIRRVGRVDLASKTCGTSKKFVVDIYDYIYIYMKLVTEVSQFPSTSGKLKERYKKNHVAFFTLLYFLWNPSKTIN